MQTDLLAQVVAELNARGHAQWAGIAKRAGVAESTLQKIAYGVNRNPSVLKVQALARVLINGNGKRR
jgi:transcriptional regulator with XRE-family HTH domain